MTTALDYSTTGAMNLKLQLVAICGLTVGTFGASSSGKQTIRELSGEKWTITNEHGNITVAGKYPSLVHLDLHTAGVIGKLI